MKIYIIYEEEERDSTTNNNKRISFYDFQALFATTFEPSSNSPYWEACELHGDLTEYVSLVIARYSDGSTFSHQEGRGQILAGYTSYKEALASAKIVKSTNSAKHLGIHAHWGGYFSHLEGTNVTIVPLYTDKNDIPK